MEHQLVHYTQHSLSVITCHFVCEKQFLGIKESRKSSGKLNPYIVLESTPDDNLEAIRKKYIKLSKEHHPDLLISKGVPKEVINASKEKMRSINSAWDTIQKLKSN